MDLNSTLMLAFEDMKELQKEERCSTMVIAWKKKKETLQKQQEERRQLERKLKRFVKNAKTKGSDRASTNTITKLEKSVVDWDAHSRENQALRAEIKRWKVFKDVVWMSSQAVIDATQLVLLPVDSRSGRRVYFKHEEPSFHFYLFTKAEFDTGMEHFEAELTKGRSVVTAGNVLGWDVYRAPLETNGNSVIQRAQLAKRLNCSLGQILRESYKKDKYVFPMVVAPVGFSLYQRHTVSVNILQRVDETARVCVCNIPGPDKHLRFMYFIRQNQQKFPDGRRRIEFSIAVADSTLNRYSREADESHNVEWVTEGGIHVSLTEVNETTVDGVWSHWADCESKIHADYMMVQWTQFASLWEQMVASKGLLD